MRAGNTIPVDKEAALVTSKGFNESLLQFRKECRSGANAKKEPSLCVKPPDDITDYTGVEYGELTVIGYLFSKTRPNGKGCYHIWQVRCRCGLYENRNHKQIARALRGKLHHVLCRYCYNIGKEVSQ